MLVLQYAYTHRKFSHLIWICKTRCTHCVHWFCKLFASVRISLLLIVSANRSTLLESIQIEKASCLDDQDAFLLTRLKNPIYRTDLLTVWHHRLIALVGERNRQPKWFESTFSSGFIVLKNERMLFTFRRSYVNLKRREPWLLEKGR